MKAVTGNRLSDGAVVYLADDDRWTHLLACAAWFADDDADAVLDAARQRRSEITDAYLIDDDGKGVLSPRIALRENIRASGPTVRPDLGNQGRCLL